MTAQNALSSPWLKPGAPSAQIWWIRIEIDTDGVDYRQHDSKDVLDAILLDVSEKLGTLAFRQLTCPDIPSSKPYARTRLSGTTGSTGFVEVIGCPWVRTNLDLNKESFPIPVLNKLVAKVQEWEQDAYDLLEGTRKELTKEASQQKERTLVRTFAIEDTLRKVTREIRAILFSDE